MTARPSVLPAYALAVALTLALGWAASPAARSAPRPKLKGAWPSRDDMSARVGPAATSPVAAGRPLSFMEPCLVLEERQAQGEGWLYLARRSAPGAAVGWVERGDVLTSPAAEVDPVSGSPQFVVISNTVLSLQSPGAEELVEAPLRKVPRADARESGSARLADLYFRYATSGGFVLVGSEPRFDPDADGGRPGKAVAGWVSEDLTVRFESRFAATWDRSSTLPEALLCRPASGRVYRDPREAYEALKEAGPALFEEQADEDNAGLELLPASPRMPVLSLVANDEFPEFDPGSNNHLLRVAGLGVLLADDEKPQTRAEVERINAELKRLSSQLTTARQVLFVIDDTESMGPQFRRVAKTVQNILDDATKNPDQVVQVAVSYYNDNPDGRPPGYQPMRLVDARSVAGRALLNEVGTHGNRLVNGGDFPEMVTEGLDHALDTAGFETLPDASRLVVLIGDHGNRQEPDYDRLVGKLLRSDRGTLDMVVYQVVDPEELPRYRGDTDQKRAKQAQAAARGFRDQLTTLVNRLNEKAAAGRKVGAFVPMPNKGANLTELLDQKLDDLKKRKSELEETRARLGARSFPTKVGPSMKSILNDRGVSVKKIQSLVGFRVGHEGYVWHWFKPPLGDEPGVPQVRIEALLSRPEAQKLVSLLGPILSAQDTLAEVRKSAGEDVSMSFERSVLTPLGLPSTALMFHRPVQTLTRELVGDELPKARERLGRLRALADPARPSPRWFRLRDGSIDWCWIDAETEIP